MPRYRLTKVFFDNVRLRRPGEIISLDCEPDASMELVDDAPAEPGPELHADELETLTVVELRAMAKQAGVEATTTLSKADLIESIRNTEMHGSASLGSPTRLP